MNPNTGELSLKQDSTYSVPVIRDLTKQERLDMQIKLYSPCVCGSGKKFKFCCKTKKSAT